MLLSLVQPSRVTSRLNQTGPLEDWLAA